MTPTLPSWVRAICTNHDAWIVGGGANPYLTEPPRDWDVLVPFDQWNVVAAALSNNHPGAGLNSFGGIKVTSATEAVDIWPGDLSFVMRQAKARWAWHPPTDTRISKL